MRGQHIKITSAGLSLADADLQQIFKIKYGDLQSTGWGPRRRHKFDYYQPADYYEAVVNKVVRPETRWVDVGGGGDIFPENRALARELSGRAQRLVGVDPSDNIETHDILHDHAKVMIEDFDTDERFDLATLRMVAEHIADPPA
ncbi:MAG: methyltransferase domain-containing protein, partial [Gammaproteobacteria bacterium]|nr:methyltransferase domain-containing protein [Gammaproteobacteria bacterium]